MNVESRSDFAAGLLELSALAVKVAEQLGPDLDRALAMVQETVAAGGTLFFCGNGGSAADAQHLATEYVVRYMRNRRAYPAIALTTDTSVLTAIGNDYNFDQVFERQVRGLGRPGDVFVGISTSGRSANVVQALRTARDVGVTTIGFTKAGDTPMHPLCDLVLAVPADEVALIQQIHITAAHAICGLVERALFPSASARAR